ncbi:unknown [Cryptophlebia leucotreta granulovirus]|uniref:Uncharacterized protein n=1 Tax=Cryptophlebia leucotreta granulosis virus TaxID=35254 RepID=Q7T5Q6_GVCL|nr:hypothetical protein [Cryptophlebia leucotreta granulovirus]AAQ21628.1 unknown [Cryptophlebia leucotreta granulovirus]AUF82028.1 hypothetical protein [Cryptophlebia leucotreta granulovirus]
MDLYYLIHETSFTSLFGILKSGHIFTSSKTQEIMEARGQGGKNRRLTSDPAMSLKMTNFYELYDEVDGVYMRLCLKTESLRTQFSDCVMLFSSLLLKNYEFVINTEENFGFLISEEGVVGESQFSGEPGFSITSLESMYLLEDYPNILGNEVLIRNDVNLKYLRSVFFNTPPPDDLVTVLENKRIPYFNIS